ncbi:MAG: response regulator, partial [Myxococcales bacterium]|nr:response regulator [Myxococcales bacterium]
VAPRPPKKRKDGKLVVLVVDDEQDIRRLLRRVLEEKGFEVLEAGRGLEALQLVRDGAPDLILLDAMLPEVHGFEICRRIKGSRRYGHIPIIMISAIYRGWRVAEDLMESYGAFAFLEKPFRMSEVLDRIDAALHGTSAEPEDEITDNLSEQAELRLSEGLDAYQKGDLDAAVEALKEGIAVDPLSFRLHYHLGLIHGQREEVFDAIASLETAVNLSPRNYAALKNLAVLYQKAGFKRKSVEVWERTLGAAPDDETKRGIKEHLMNLL